MSSKVSIIDENDSPEKFKQELERIISVPWQDIEEIKWDKFNLSEEDKRKYGIGDEGWITLANWLKTNTSLKVLQINNNSIGPIGMKAISEALVGNNILRQLDLQENNIGDEGLKELSKLLTVNSSIQLLNLMFNKIGNEGMKELSKALTLNSSIITLDLGYNNINDERMKELSKALAVNSSIQTLSLFYNNIGDEGIKELSKAVTFNSSIQTLYLGGNNIGDKGMEALSNVIAFNSTLRYLNLSNNRYAGNLSLKSIARALTLNSTLLSLNLAYCHIENNNIIKQFLNALKINSTLDYLSFGGYEINKLVAAGDDKIAADVLQCLLENKYLTIDFAWKATNEGILKQIYEEINSRVDKTKNDSKSVIQFEKSSSASVSTVFKHLQQQQLMQPIACQKLTIFSLPFLGNDVDTIFINPSTFSNVIHLSLQHCDIVDASFISNNFKSVKHLNLRNNSNLDLNSVYCPS